MHQFELDGCGYYDCDNINEVFRLIIENCNNLSEINVFYYINGSNFEEFQQKFGQKIKYLPNMRKPTHLNRFPNIEKIDYMIDYSVIAGLNLAKLKQLKINVKWGEEHMLQTVINNFPTLTHFNVNISSFDENAIHKSLKNISKLKHLIHFEFHNQFETNDRICDLFKQMANSCRNLKSIEFGYVISDQNSNITQLLVQLKAFPLKRLNLELTFKDNIDVNQLFSFELFKDFSNITHLSICFDWRQTLKESILREIDINLPNLQYLEIKFPFDTTPEGVQQMAETLSRLSRLQTIKLKFKSGVDFKPIKEQITNHCRKIKQIKLFSIE